MYSICVLDFSLFVFSVMRYFQTMDTAVMLQLGEAPGPQPFTHRDVDWWKRVQPAMLVSCVVVGVCASVTCVWTVILQREFRWAVYRHISGSLEMMSTKRT